MKRIIGCLFVILGTLSCTSSKVDSDDLETISLTESDRKNESSLLRDTGDVSQEAQKAINQNIDFGNDTLLRDTGDVPREAKKSINQNIDFRNDSLAALYSDTLYMTEITGEFCDFGCRYDVKQLLKADSTCRAAFVECYTPTGSSEYYIMLSVDKSKNRIIELGVMPDLGGSDYYTYSKFDYETYSTTYYEISKGVRTELNVVNYKLEDGFKLIQQ